MTTLELPKAAEWDQLLAVTIPWQDAYATVERHARALVGNFHRGHPKNVGVSTTQLVQFLYPEEHARGPAGVYARQRIFKALAALATRGLADCATRGSVVVHAGGRGREVRPWLWHAPTVPNEEAVGRVCPECKRPYTMQDKLDDLNAARPLRRVI